jgi:acetyl esterase/lipase
MLLLGWLFLLNTAWSQKNKYGMELKKTDGKACEIVRIDEIAGLVDTSTLTDLYVKYEYKPVKIKEADYSGCKTIQCVFKEYPSYSLKMEVDLPLNPTVSPVPFIIYIHGGGWSGGSLTGFKDYSQYLATKGIAGVRISYSLKKNKGDFNMGIEEVDAAFGYVEQKAKEWNLDMKNFGFAGGSAGSPLAAYWAMKKENCKLLIGYNGIYNFTGSKPGGSFPGENNSYLKTAQTQEKLKEISALFNIPAKNPPAVLVAHGTADPTISYLQSVALCDAVEKRGGIVKRLIYPGYVHSFFNQNNSDKYEEVVMESYQFAKKIFKIK